jgi:hypothetical protein
MIEQALFSRLSTFAGLITVPIYPDILPQNAAMPTVTFQRITTERVSVMGVDSGIARARFQVDSWSRDYGNVKAIAAQVRAALQRFRGIVGSDEILEIFILNEADLFEPDTLIHRVSQDYEVNHRE